MFVFFKFENNKMTDTVNHGISSEYVDEKHACSLLLAMHSVTVLSSGFQGLSVCCFVKPNNAMYLDFGGKTVFFEKLFYL